MESSSARKPYESDEDDKENGSFSLEEEEEGLRNHPHHHPHPISVSENASALIISACDKAGMQGIDRNKIDAIILRESGTSKFMQQQRKRDEKVNTKIQQLKQKLFAAHPNEYAIRPEMEEIVQTFQRQHNHMRAACVVVDMDMFYMACELLTRPQLQNVPACVGSGMILTSNYKARKYGVRSAMPGFIGDKLVQELSNGKETLVHVPSHFDLYKQKSAQTMQVLKEYDPNIKSYSLDEAYLDLGPYLVHYLQWRNTQRNTAIDQDLLHQQIQRLLLSNAATTTSNNNDNDSDDNAKSLSLSSNPEPPSPQAMLQSYSPQICQQAVERIVSHMRRRVHDATGGLTCSAGIAPNFMLAKIASDYNKPNGQYFVDPQAIDRFIHPLPVRKIPGIGRVTEKILNQVGQIHTVQQLYEQRGLVAFLFQPATSQFLLRASVGSGGSSSSSTNSSAFGMDALDDTTTDEATDANNNNNNNNNSHQKGISRERTFRAESSWTMLNVKLEDIARMLSKDMQRKQVLAHTITIKVKLDTFDVWSRAKTLPRNVYIQQADDLVKIASETLKELRANYGAKQSTTTGSSSGGDQKGSSSSSSSSSSVFTCRLLGIRCSNLIDEKDHVSLDLQQQSSAMERFLSKPTTTATTATTPTATTTSAAPPNVQQPASTTKSDPFDKNGRQQTRMLTTTPTPGAKPVTPRSSKPATKPAFFYNKQRHDGVLVGSGGLGGNARDTQDRSSKHNHDAGLAEESMASSATTAVLPVTNNHPRIETAECPLCKQQIVASDNDALNQHIDSCLSASTVRNAVKEASRLPAGPKTKKRKRLTDFW